MTQRRIVIFLPTTKTALKVQAFISGQNLQKNSHPICPYSFNFLNMQFGSPFDIDEGPTREGLFSDIKTKVPAYQLRTDITYKITDNFLFEPGILQSS